ncbi:amino-acid N-acetyltransferase [Streptomyces fradiae]|nr:amino-acid N-acetyltransferase [Streptomyces fradiae]WOI63149.1 amino-acid N-acetyltransferase [Streptomyces fradiae]
MSPTSSGPAPEPEPTPTPPMPALAPTPTRTPAAPATPGSTPSTAPTPAPAPTPPTADRARTVTVRRARTSDVPAVRRLVDPYVARGILLDKATVTLYEDIQEFWVAERDEDAAVVGCGALHVMWEDLAEVRTLAVDPDFKGAGVGHQVLDKLLHTARWLGVRRVFCLTFEVDFFAKHGFVEIGETPVDGDVYSELLRSYDEGVAEFLGLERVKPNTLGNSRMLLHL